MFRQKVLVIIECDKPLDVITIEQAIEREFDYFETEFKSVSAQSLEIEPVVD